MINEIVEETYILFFYVLGYQLRFFLQSSSWVSVKIKKNILQEMTWQNIELKRIVCGLHIKIVFMTSLIILKDIQVEWITF